MDRSKLRLPACLVIMDGFGLEEAGEGNAISLADTPNLDKLFADCEWVKLQASGNDVGLPAGQMGNSEVGHLNIGAGRVVHQELTRIDRACEDGTLSTNPILLDTFDSVKKNNGVLHLMGLLSDGGVHSSNKHLYALIEAALKAGVKCIHIHCFLDGRDVPPSSAVGYIEELNERIDDLASAYSVTAGEDVKIASVMGRYYAMDRDNRWDRVKLAYETLVCGTSKTALSPADAVKDSYDQDIVDEFVVPVAFDERGMKDGDSVIFFNFRPDRAREITRSIVEDGFKEFPRQCNPKVDFVCLTEYDPDIPAPIAFPKTFPEHVLADVLAENGLSQYHIAETEKYAHVTFFLNGGIEEPKEGEQRVLIASPHVATYDLKPEMSEPEVASTLVKAIEEDAADVYIVNFANCDMIGHTGSIPAAKAAVEAVDAGVGSVISAIRDKGGVAFVTADHGNADKMLSEDGGKFTAHTTAPVPFILVNATNADMHLSGQDGKLADIAPTLLNAIGIPVPSEMTGSNLLV